MTQDAFETWARQDWKEVDLSRLPSGEYRVQSVRDMSRAYAAAHSSQQAEIDRLMWEFCPKDMTAMQIREWLAAQKVVVA